MKILDFIYDNLYENEKYKHSKSKSAGAKLAYHSEESQFSSTGAWSPEEELIEDISKDTSDNENELPALDFPLTGKEYKMPSGEDHFSASKHIKALIDNIKESLEQTYKGCFICDKLTGEINLTDTLERKDLVYEQLSGLVAQINSLLVGNKFPSLNDYLLIDLKERKKLLCLNLDYHQFTLYLDENANLGMLTGIIIPQIKKQYHNVINQ